ncbi:MAG: hypothetical protein HKN37_10135 [Rhodothermales bacterium]|nr:hypothetical protein [Rhodothermales bacterium]
MLRTSHGSCCLTLLLCLGLAGQLNADALGQDIGVETQPPQWTSDAVRMTFLHGSASVSESGTATGRRSVPLALGLSAVVPGLGQGYNRQWLKAGLSIAVEAALVLGYVKWKNDGLDGERAFQAQAHAEWSPTRYAEWLNDYVGFLEINHGGVFTVQDILIPSPDQLDFTEPAGWTESELITVRRLFNEIRATESQMFHPETGATFSHVLPYFGEQQYYELIGKYFQFAPGWEDYPDWVVEDEYTDAIDPERSDGEGGKVSVSPKFYSYARDHARSQDLLRRASRVTSLIIVNHVISAIDAAVFSRLHNDRLSARMEMVNVESGRHEPRAVLTLQF